MINFDSTMKKAVFFTALIMILISLVGGYSNPALYPPLILIFAIIAEFIISIALVLMLKIVREKHPSLNVFGYLWRALVLRQLTIFFSVVVAMIISYKPPLPSLAFTAFLDFVSIFSTPGVAWLCFSKGRRGQFAWAVNSLVGREIILRK